MSPGSGRAAGGEAAERWWIVGCGDLGLAVARGVLAEGGEVLGSRREPHCLPAAIRGPAVDLLSGRGLDEVPEAIDVVLLCAAAGRGAGPDGYQALYVDGTRRLVGALHERGARPRLLLFTSSTAVYAQRDGSLVDEESPTEPDDYRGTTMLAAERLVLESGVPAGVLRLGGIYGPGRTGFVDAVRDGRIGVTADGHSAWTNRIHVEDAAAAVRHVAALGEPADRYVVVDREPARRDDVVRWLGARLGVELATAPATAAAAGRGGADRACSSARLQRSGFRWRYPSYREGYGSLL